MSDEAVICREWFAMRVRTNYEKVVSKALEFRELESFLPTYQEPRIWSDRTKKIHQPLFPGYVFCRLNPGERVFALLAPGAMNLIGIGATPKAIPETEIESLKALIRSFEVKPWPFLQVGQKVRVKRGPLAGVEGVIETFRSGYRIVVSIELLHRSVAAEVDGICLAPLFDTVQRLPGDAHSLPAQNLLSEDGRRPSHSPHRNLPRF